MNNTPQDNTPQTEPWDQGQAPWLTPVTDPEDNDFPNDAMTTNQVQATPEGDYATDGQLEAFIGAPVPDQTYMDENPGDFITATDRYGYVDSDNYRSMPQAGGLTNVPAPGLLGGFNIRETSGAAAVVIRLRDGIDIGAPIVATIAVPQGMSKEVSFTMPKRYRMGLYVELVSGIFEGVLYIRQHLAK
jgi:hypothetical protein